MIPRDYITRITVRPDILGGKPIIRDMRIAVEHVLANLAAGGDRRGHTQGLSVSRINDRSLDRASEPGPTPSPAWAICRLAERAALGLRIHWGPGLDSIPSLVEPLEERGNKVLAMI